MQEKAVIECSWTASLAAKVLTTNTESAKLTTVAHSNIDNALAPYKLH